MNEFTGVEVDRVLGMFFRKKILPEREQEDQAAGMNTLQKNDAGRLLFKDRVNVLIRLHEEEVKKVRAALRRRRFKFAERDYAHFTAVKAGLHVTAYQKGPKVLIQGNEAMDFARSVLEPLVSGLNIVATDGEH
ncbi:MAG: hypothetical protein OSA48_03355 [Akkermansiaceae bacterium]|nr:hypothetical protein [Akkermansiaceae bacterium]